MLLEKKQRNVCYNFFESLFSFAHFKCKGYILYSKLLLQWAVEKKKFCLGAKIKKIISRNFQVSHWKKKYVSIIFEVKRQKKMFRRKKILTVNLPWNDPYIYICKWYANLLFDIKALCKPYCMKNNCASFLVISESF